MSAISRPKQSYLLALATLALCVLAIAQGQRQGDALLSEMHPAGCPPISVNDLSPLPWNATTPLEIGRAAETWQFHTLETTGEPVETIAVCAARPMRDQPSASTVVRRFATPQQIYNTQLGWLTALQIMAVGILLVALSIAAGKQVPKALTGLVTVITLAAWTVERVELRRQINTAWSEAVGGGLVDLTRLDVGLLNRAANVRWISMALLLGLLAVPAIPLVLAAVRAVRLSSRGIRFPLVVSAAGAIAILAVPQVDDAARRWGIGQTTLSFCAAIVVGLVVALSGTRRPAALRVSAAEGDRRQVVRPEVIPTVLGSMVLAAAAAFSGWSGLYVPASLLAAVSLASLLVERGTRWDAELEASDIDNPARSWLIAISGALPTLALGLVAIRVGAADQLGLRSPSALNLALIGSLAVGATASLAIGLRSFHLAADRAPLRSAVMLGVIGPAVALPLVVSSRNTWAADIQAGLGVIPIFCSFLAATLATVGLLRLVGDALVRHPTRWRYLVPPALLVAGARRSPLVGLLATWIVVLPILGPGSYHDVRLLQQNAPEFQPPAVRPIGGVAADWLRRQDLDERPVLPVLSASASGGGIRSAYWTAAVLDCVIDGATVGDDPCAGRATPTVTAQRRNSLLLLSGVSGGSLGLVSYVAEVDDGWQVPKQALAPRWYDNRLGADFQATVFSHLLFGDVVEFFLRSGSGQDRAAALEVAFESQWPNGEFSRGFLTGQSAGEPLLVLEGYSAEDGCRFNVSALDANGLRAGDDCGAGRFDSAALLHGTTDLADFLCGDDDLRRSTAALLSARFPYVTPSGQLKSESCHRRPVETHIVDGGYRGGSATSVIAELWPTLEQSVQTELDDRSAGSCLLPIHLHIDNGELNTESPGKGQPNQVVLPLAAIARTGAGADSTSQSIVSSLFDQSTGVIDQRTGAAPRRQFVISPIAHPGAEAPLGWSLSPTSRADLQDQLRVNRRDIEELRRLLDGDDLTCPSNEPAQAQTQEESRG